MDAEVIVIGAGVAGACLQYELAVRGVDVLLLERGAGPSGASTIPAALLNPYRGRSARARQLDRDGLAAFWRLHERLVAAGSHSGAHRSGVLRAASDRRQARGWQRLVSGASEDALVWLEPREFPSPYHAPFGGLLVRQGGWLEPRRLLDALSGAAAGLGARTLFRHRLKAWRPSPGGGVIARAVSEAAGEPAGVELSARALVLCLGAYDPSGCHLPRLELATGVAIRLAKPEGMTAGRFAPLAGAAGIVGLEETVVVSGGSLPTRETGPSSEELAHAAARLRSTANWSLPLLERAEQLGTWHGVRARRASGTPVLRRLAAGVTLFGGLAGRGFLAGPLLAGHLAASLSVDL